MNGILNWRKCIVCGCHFDTGINFDKCINCREEKKSDKQRKLRENN